MQSSSYYKSYDKTLSFVLLLLVVIGMMSVFSAEYTINADINLDFKSGFGKQLLWLGVSILFFAMIAIIDVRVFINLSYFIYGLTVILLMATLVLGQEISGSKSWLIIGGFSMQTSEFAKLGTALALAKYLDNSHVNIANRKHLLTALLIIGIPLGLILIQRDFGSALVFISFSLVLYRQGLSGWFIFIPIIAAILFILSLLIGGIWAIALIAIVAMFFYLFTPDRKRSFAVIIILFVIASGFVFSTDYVFNNVLPDHQKTRINVLLGKEIDLKGAGYNMHQSLIAIGSGGLTGKGYLNGTQTKLNFIPEQSTDFIFCTVAEEFGLIGSVVLIGLFTLLILRMLSLSENHKFRFTRIYGYGIISVILIHFIINIGMALGILPVIGIPLPFISRGGSSLMTFIVMVAIFLKLEREFRHYFN